MIKTPLFPTYSRTKKLMKFLNEKPYNLFQKTWSTIWEMRGTPQDTVDWQNPDQWIFERLLDDEEVQDFAYRLWVETERSVNPRHMRGILLLMNNYDLMDSYSGVFKITEKGRLFINDDLETIKHIDHEEGVDYILYLCSIKKNAKISNFYEEWEEYSLRVSNNKKESVFKDSLRRRLNNLLDRELVTREGNRYNIEERGISYLKYFEGLLTEDVSEEQNLHRRVDDFNKLQKEKLYNYLKDLNPTKFEYLVKDLLDSMGYEDVQVTSATNDKGVDVTAKIQNGISTIVEVIQVKRFQGNIQREVLDRLRGSLHRFDAFQGTIITLSDFSKGTKNAAFERGAPPITLINGDKLIELLIENSIVVKKKNIEYTMVDENYFTDNEEEEE